MKKFIILYHAPMGAMEKMASATPEDAQKGMEPWMEWARHCGSGLVDMGSPLTNAQKVKKDGAAASQSTVVGYSVLQAENMDKALAMVKDHPHLQWMDSCEVEVHETMPLPGM
jgi:hypothetical protein